MAEIGCAGCLVYMLVAIALAVPIAIIIVVMQGVARRRAWAILRGRQATRAEIKRTISELSSAQDSESKELVRRLMDLLQGEDK